MSVKTWKAEFYPTSARVCSKVKASEHSLQKWRGLLPSNLDRHGVELRYGDVRLKDSGAVMCVPISSGTCSLCQRFSNHPVGSGCRTCPLAIVRGGVACHNATPKEGTNDKSPWVVFCHDEDPKPMIAWLKKAVKFQQAQLKEKKS